MGEVTMYRTILGYLERLPGAMKETTETDGEPEMRCLYTPHSLRATTATLLLDGSTDIRKVQELLGHRHVTPRRFTTSGGGAPPTAPVICW
jgi:integrase